MKIELNNSAKKQLSKLPKSEAKKVFKKLLQLENQPFEGKRLRGKLLEKFSLKAWPYRIIYQIEKDSIFVIDIEHRQGVYKH